MAVSLGQLRLRYSILHASVQALRERSLLMAARNDCELKQLRFIRINRYKDLTVAVKSRSNRPKSNGNFALAFETESE